TLVELHQISYGSNLAFVTQILNLSNQWNMLTRESAQLQRELQFLDYTIAERRLTRQVLPEFLDWSLMLSISSHEFCLDIAGRGSGSQQITQGWRDAAVGTLESQSNGRFLQLHYYAVERFAHPFRKDVVSDGILQRLT